VIPNEGGTRLRPVVPLLLTAAILGALALLRKTGLFQQVGAVSTACIVGANLFVMGLVWWRAFR
jgi:hypothetical protein